MVLKQQGRLACYHDLKPFAFLKIDFKALDIAIWHHERAYIGRISEYFSRNGLWIVEESPYFEQFQHNFRDYLLEKAESISNQQRSVLNVFANRYLKIDKKTFTSLFFSNALKRLQTGNLSFGDFKANYDQEAIDAILELEDEASEILFQSALKDHSYGLKALCALNFSEIYRLKIIECQLEYLKNGYITFEQYAEQNNYEFYPDHRLYMAFCQLPFQKMLKYQAYFNQLGLNTPQFHLRVLLELRACSYHEVDRSVWLPLMERFNFSSLLTLINELSFKENLFVVDIKARQQRLSQIYMSKTQFAKDQLQLTIQRIQSKLAKDLRLQSLHFNAKKEVVIYQQAQKSLQEVMVDFESVKRRKDSLVKQIQLNQRQIAKNDQEQKEVSDSIALLEAGESTREERRTEKERALLDLQDKERLQRGKQVQGLMGVIASGKEASAIADELVQARSALEEVKGEKDRLTEQKQKLEALKLAKQTLQEQISADESYLDIQEKVFLKQESIVDEKRKELTNNQGPYERALKHYEEQEAVRKKESVAVIVQLQLGHDAQMMVFETVKNQEEMELQWQLDTEKASLDTTWKHALCQLEIELRALTLIPSAPTF